MSSKRFPRGVLFDLDGTLLDSAPDMLATVNILRALRDEPPMRLEELRSHVSKGSRAMIRAAFPHLDADVRETMVRPFLDTYERELGRHGMLFDGVEAMLEALEADGTRWGIVTNKPEYLAQQMMPILGWTQRCAVLIGGDTLPERKPHPLPLLHAAELMHLPVDDCIYVGDDERDIIASTAAGMRSVVALWGYRPIEDEPADWGGDVMIDTVHQLLDAAVWPRKPE